VTTQDRPGRREAARFYFGRHSTVDHVSTGGGFLKLSRNMTPRMPCAMLLGQMPHEFPHIAERPERHDRGG